MERLYRKVRYEDVVYFSPVSQSERSILLNPNFRWAGDRLFVGNWLVGSIYFKEGCPLRTESPYSIYCTLPGVSQPDPSFPREEAKLELEDIVQAWLEGLNK